VEEELDYKDDGDIKIPMKQGDDNCNSVSAKKKKMSPIRNEKRTDDDVFDVIVRVSEGYSSRMMMDRHLGRSMHHQARIWSRNSMDVWRGKD
jgi:hypothetical protein